MRHIPMIVATLAVAIWPAVGSAADKDERAGTCSDARLQMEYFCDPAKAETDSMVAMGTACTNAKKNVEAACDGKVEPDKPYK